MSNEKVVEATTTEATVKKTVTDEASKESLKQAVKKAEEKKDVFAGVDFDSLEITMSALLKAGSHFGHQKSRYNPKMKDYIYTTRNNISIIDLAQTVDLMKESLEFLTKVKSSGKQILFVGTKKQSQPFVKAVAELTGNPFVIERWLGGTFTNFRNIRKRVRYMSRLKDQMEKGELKKYTKFEQAKLQEELEKLDRRMGGITDMANIPGAVFITDLNADKLAVKEAKKLKVPVVVIADTNVNPADADYLIPANDDAVSSIKFIMAHICKTLK